MSLLQVVLVLDVVLLVALTAVSALAEARGARDRRRAAEADWALLRSWLDEAPTR
ncbi:hypothetical protein Kfla_3518 [Kribbella flavida DSM 17836]|uniref:Uncharacterized protein n=1 Tax=Kribbella flavida (strain DSM 17836 / JCM 10339 / NBRC 14399) TaxID=479435 RepID=D2PLZ6_KRIFD|nr:hypothetical protein [Kribbella flavida]ADB32576.1 hypothetical protein Kfla_3518 [Kribbella flavida DSM 17836]